VSNPTLQKSGGDSFRQSKEKKRNGVHQGGRGGFLVYLGGGGGESVTLKKKEYPKVEKKECSYNFLRGSGGNRGMVAYAPEKTDLEKGAFLDGEGRGREIPCPPFRGRRRK